MSRKSRALIEIRLRRSNDLVQQEAVAVVHKLWRPDTPHNREKLAFVAHQGNRLFGADTHWVERRLA